MLSAEKLPVHRSAPAILELTPLNRPNQVVIDILETQPLLRSAPPERCSELQQPQSAPPERCAPLPSTAVTRVAQHLGAGDLHSMAQVARNWRGVLGMPAIWLDASRRAGTAQLLRAKERLALSDGGCTTADARARRIVFCCAAAPLFGGYIYLGVSNCRQPAVLSQLAGGFDFLIAPLLGFQVGCIALRAAQPLFTRLQRAADRRDERADLRMEQLEFGQACALEILTTPPSRPAVQQAALNVLKRGMLQNESDATRVIASFTHAMDQHDLPRIEAMITADIARVAIDLQAAPKVVRRLVMLLITANRTDLIVSLAQKDLRLDAQTHGEVSAQSLLVARLTGHLREGKLEAMDPYIAVLPQAATAHLPWTGQAMDHPLMTADLQAFPALLAHLSLCFDAACARGDHAAAATLLRMGCHRSAAASQHLVRHLAQAVQAQDWALVATLHQKLAVDVDHLAIKLDQALFVAVAEGNVAAVRHLRAAGALGKLLDASGRSPATLARALGAPDVIAALQGP